MSMKKDEGSHSLKIDARREKIQELLERDGQVRVTQLAELLNTTTVTIRSDLDSMEEDGLVERVQGGAVPTVINLYNREFMRRKRMFTEQKRAIALAAADLVEDGDTLFINGGSTTYFAALMLRKARKNLSVVTNSVSVATELGTSPTFTVILVGGQINSYCSFTYGSQALNQLQQYHVSKTLLSIDGVNENGVTTIHPEESVVAKAMIENAKQNIIIADSSKIGKDGFCNICRLPDVDLLITDRNVNSAELEKIAASGINIQLV